MKNLPDLYGQYAVQSSEITDLLLTLMKSKFV